MPEQERKFGEKRKMGTRWGTPDDRGNIWVEPFQTVPRKNRFAPTEPQRKDSDGIRKD